MGEAIFWDTWAFLAIAEKDYPYHQVASEISERLQQQQAFSKVRRRSAGIKQIDFAHEMVKTGEGHILSVPTDLWQRAFDLYKQRPDKDWGHTDCISFIVMRELGLEKAFTADQHFEQAGFT